MPDHGIREEIRKDDRQIKDSRSWGNRELSQDWLFDICFIFRENHYFPKI